MAVSVVVPSELVNADVYVDVAGKLVNVDVSFKDKLGAPISAPTGSVYTWSVTTGMDKVSVAGSGAGDTTGVITPIAAGDAVVTLTVSGGTLTAPLTGTLAVTVLAMEPASIALNGTVVDA